MFEYYDKMQERLKNHPFLNDIKEFILSCEDENLGKYLAFLYLNMPYADLANVKKEVISDYAMMGVNLRQTRCADMDEDIFLNYVLFHRVGDEKIVSNRFFFYNLVKDLLGKDEKENVIKLNYWCAKNVTYRSTDDRTLDPVSVYNSGYGRCGEESIFTVSVLRAAGIPARQVYAPYWAHCDDNHAWVEVYVDNAWHYLGACEPEEILDKGWFDDASARAMTVRSLLYDNSGKEIGEDTLSFNEGVYEINRTKSYADTRHIRLYISEGKKALADTSFNICLMNYAGFLPIIKAETDNEGMYETDIGCGSIFLSLYREKNYIIPLNTAENEVFYIDIKNYEPEYNTYKELMVFAPPASTRNRKKNLPKKKYKYEKKPFPNIETQAQVFSEGMESLWDILSEKNKRDISIEVLRECYLSSNVYAVDFELYRKFIQNPVVATENLNPCRAVFKKEFLNIKSILSFVSEIRLTREKIITEPMGVYETMTGSALSVKIFVVNILRSMGIASRLVNSEVFVHNGTDFIPFNELSEALESLKYIDGSFVPEEIKKKDRAYLRLHGDLSYFKESFSIARYDRHEDVLLPLDKSEIKENMKLPVGEYVITTANRLPSGNTCCKYNILKLEAGSECELDLEYMQPDVNDMLTKFVVPKRLQKKLKLSGKEGRLSLVMWLKEEEEPTQHIANDLLSKDNFLKDFKLKLLFTKKFEGKDHALNELLEKNGEAEIYTDLGEGLQEEFGRSLFVNHETLPIVALCKDNVAVYAFSGYQVGSQNLIEKITKLVREQE